MRNFPTPSVIQSRQQVSDSIGSKRHRERILPTIAAQMLKPKRRHIMSREKRLPLLCPGVPNMADTLQKGPTSPSDPLFHAGLYYAQEASSMFVDLVVRQLIHEPVVMLDLCAAPGGKSTAVRNVLPDGSLLFSNEPMRTRAQILAENMQKFDTLTLSLPITTPRISRRLAFSLMSSSLMCPVREKACSAKTTGQ